MKRIIVLVMILLVAMMLFGCGKDAHNDNRTNPDLTDDNGGSNASSPLPEPSAPTTPDDSVAAPSPGTPATPETPDAPTGSEQPQTPVLPEKPANDKLTGISVSHTEFALKMNESIEIPVEVAPSDYAKPYTLSIENSNNNVASVKRNGNKSFTVSALKPGTTVVTVAVLDFSVNCTITVPNPTISTAEELFAVTRFDDDITYEIIADIDVSGYAGSDARVRGIIEGNGHRIYNIEHGDLFSTNNGTIRNLILECNINIDENEGAKTPNSILVGINSGTIENCIIKGNINITGNSIHFGTYASSNNGTIIKCANYADINVTGKYINPLGNSEKGNRAFVAGIVQTTLSGTISQCFNRGNIAVSNFLITEVSGIACDARGTVENCYNAGTVASADQHPAVGGLFCTVYDTVINCCNFGKATSGIAYTNRGYIVDNYYAFSLSDKDAINTLELEKEESSDSIRVYRLADEQLNDSSSYPTLDFENIWKVSETDPFPIFQWEK